MSRFMDKTAMSVDALTGMRGDQLVARVAKWLDIIEGSEICRTGDLVRARGEVAEALKIAPGTLERIRRRRVKDVRGTVLAAIRGRFAEVARQQIRGLEDELSIALAMGLPMDSPQAREGVAALLDSRADARR